MFGFFLQRKRDEVRRLLSGRMNRQYFRQFRYGERFAPRGSFCEVVWVIPLDPQTDQPRCEDAFPAVTKDICHEGLSLVLGAAVEGERVLVGLQTSSELSFLRCRCQHSTSLGYGFHQVGLHPEEIVHLDMLTVTSLRRHFSRFETSSETESAEVAGA